MAPFPSLLSPLAIGELHCAGDCTRGDAAKPTAALRSGLIAADDASRLVASGIVDDEGTEAATTRDFDRGDEELDAEFCIASWCSRSGDRDVGALLPR